MTILKDLIWDCVQKIFDQDIYKENIFIYLHAARGWRHQPPVQLQWRAGHKACEDLEFLNEKKRKGRGFLKLFNIVEKQC